MEITEKAYAKLNISLDIVRKMPNGYHEMKMVMQSIELHDDIKIICIPGNGKIAAKTNLHFLPNDTKNIAAKAVEVFFAQNGIRGYDTTVELHKRTPVCAGMGGGSSDGAAVLRGLNTMFNTKLSEHALCKMAEKLGSDVPFCVAGGTSLATGRGEILTPLTAFPECYIVVSKPCMSISTPQLFSKIRCNQIKLRPDTEGIINALNDYDISGICKRMYNVFENVLPRSAQEIFDIKSKFLDCHALGSIMTGTGSAVFGIFDNLENAQNAYNELKKDYADTFLTKPIGRIKI